MTYQASLTIEEKVGSLFQPDPVLPAQYLETCQGRTPSPEKRLMLAVLEDAIMCFKKYAPAQGAKENRLFCEAEDWILEKNSKWFFSFENICAAFELDPNYIRRGLTQGKEKLRSQSLEPRIAGLRRQRKRHPRKGNIDLSHSSFSGN
jgi:hypothetical protein